MGVVFGTTGSSSLKVLVGSARRQDGGIPKRLHDYLHSSRTILNYLTMKSSFCTTSSFKHSKVLLNRVEVPLVVQHGGLLFGSRLLIAGSDRLIVMGGKQITSTCTKVGRG